jgi:hypothetical protein
MSKYDVIATKIIKEQESLMGPVAWYEAGKVKGLKIVDQNVGTVAIDDSANSMSVVDDLVTQYDNLFGRAAREVCKEAVTALVADLQPSEVPSSLK